VSVQDSEHEHFFLGRSTDELKEIVGSFLRVEPVTEDHDADWGAVAGESLVDSHGGNLPRYSAARLVIEARDASLRKAGEILVKESGWGPWQVEQFRLGCIRRSRVDLRSIRR